MKKILFKGLSFLLSFSIVFNFLYFTNLSVDSASPNLLLGNTEDYFSENNIEVSKGGSFFVKIGFSGFSGTGIISLNNGLDYKGFKSGTLQPTKSGSYLFFDNLGVPPISIIEMTADSDIDINIKNYVGNSLSVISNTLKVKVVDHLKVNSAEYLDSDFNGKLDSVKVTFNKTTTGSISGFSISNTDNGCTDGTSRVFSNGSISNENVFTLKFNECNNFDTGVIPQLNYDSSSGNFDTLKNIGDNDLIEIDSALPYNIESEVHISTNDNIEINFSERLGLGTGILKDENGNVVSGKYSVISADDNTSSKIVFNPNSDLSDSLSYSGTFIATDFRGNISTFNFGVLVSDADNEKPYGVTTGGGIGILIKDGSNKVYNTKFVNLSLGANDNNGVAGLEMSFKNNNAASWSDFEDYSSLKIGHEIQTDNGLSTGTSTVCVKFRDLAGNISDNYCDSIQYLEGDSYISFDPESVLYSDTNSILLTGKCNHITTTGGKLGNGLNFTGPSSSSTGVCNLETRTFSQEFTGLTENGVTDIRVEFTSDNSIFNTISIKNPSPKCSSTSYYTPPINSTGIGVYPNCSFSCKSGYHKNGSSCINNIRSCVIINGTGEETWVGSNWGACTLKTCNSGYVISGNTCNVYVPVLPGGGSLGGGGGGGGSIGPTIGNYTLPSSESDKLVDTFDNISFAKIKDGVLTRPLKMKELGGKYFAEIEKGTLLKCSNGKKFDGKILAPEKILTSKLPDVNIKTREISDGKYAIRAIKIGSEECSLNFDKDVKITISLSGVSKKLDRDFINIYSYDEIGEKYVIENKNRVYNEEDDSISSSVNHMTNFLAVWQNGGYKGSIGGGIGGGAEDLSGNYKSCGIKDISNHWSNEFVSELCSQGIVSGEGDTGMFKPDSSINRAALLKMLMISFGYDLESTFSQKYFLDISGDERYANYINTARKYGLVEGYKHPNALEIGRVLNKKDSGYDVVLLQDFLLKRGFYNYSTTGYYGDLTTSALKLFQKSVGIPETGVLGETDLSLINHEIRIIYDSVYDFRPASFINRAEALAMILKVAKKTVSVNYGDFEEFDDISKDQWFAKYVKYGFENGIISGKKPGIFDPSGNITKGEVSKIIIKTRNLK